MIILVTADNLLLIFLGWEGVGLVSYLLISYWFTRMAASKASLKAFYMNRVGDWGYQLGLILIITS
jgi:NADH:ubiquinone oxidoreductase subunit 5 (subunit L)/multisubunit Na+/H+ antiporter MnhA subunit